MNQTNHSSMDLSMQEAFISAFGAAEPMQNSDEELFAEANLLLAEEEEILLPENLFEEEAPTDIPIEEEMLFSPNQEKDSISAKFYGSEIPLPKKEVQALAKALGISVDNCIRLFQKGMNYDRLQKRLEEGQNADRNIAAPGNLLSGNKKKSSPSRKAAGEQKQNQRYENTDMSARTKHRTSWQETLRQYPELDLKRLPPEAISRLKAGESPLNILQQQEIEELRQKLVMAEQKQKSAARALGSVKSDAAEEIDDFLAGFLS